MLAVSAAIMVASMLLALMIKEEVITSRPLYVKDVEESKFNKDILENVIHRPYEAHVEERIDGKELDKLISHREEALGMKEEISEDHSIATLLDLKAMKEDLTKLFNERFEKLSQEIEELKKGFVKRPDEVKEAVKSTNKLQALTPSLKEGKRPCERSENAEEITLNRRIEEVMAEVEKALRKLEQMDVELQEPEGETRGR